MSKTPSFVILLLPVLLLISSCNTNQSSNTAAQRQASTTATSTPIDPATVASVSGTIRFDGPVPAPKKIDMSQDPACTGSNQGEMLVVSNGNLANVLVYIKDGLGNRTFMPPSTPVIIDQRGCRYHPHVLAAMTGQTIQIRNDDATTHNIHPMPKHNREWNISETTSSPAIQQRFANQEIMMPMKCNLHPWMRMYINVVSNPFFAVTDSAGKYEINGLPPGTYTLAFVHEKLGELDQQITLAPKENKTVDEAFKSPNGD